MFISLRNWLKMVSDQTAVSTLINLRVLSGINVIWHIPYVMTLQGSDVWDLFVKYGHIRLKSGSQNFMSYEIRQEFMFSPNIGQFIMNITCIWYTWLQTIILGIKHVISIWPNGNYMTREWGKYIWFVTSCHPLTHFSQNKILYNCVFLCFIT